MPSYTLSLTFCIVPAPQRYNSISTAVLKQCHLMNYLETLCYCLFFISVSFLTMALPLWDKSEIVSIAMAEGKVLPSGCWGFLLVLWGAGTFRDCNLTNSKCHLGHSFAAAACTQILILYFHSSLKSPQSIETEKILAVFFQTYSARCFCLGGKDVSRENLIFFFLELESKLGFYICFKLQLFKRYDLWESAHNQHRIIPF